MKIAGWSDSGGKNTRIFLKGRVIAGYRRIRGGWKVKIEDRYYGKYNYSKVHRTSRGAYADMQDQMRDISDDVRQRRSRL